MGRSDNARSEPPDVVVSSWGLVGMLEEGEVKPGGVLPGALKPLFLVSILSPLIDDKIELSLILFIINPTGSIWYIYIYIYI